MRIVYSLDSLSIVGGTERVTVVKANALAAVPGNEVYIIVSDNYGKDVSYDLSPAVHLIDLGAGRTHADYKEPGSILVCHYRAWKQRRVRKKQIRHLFDEIKPDIVVSAGPADRNALASLKGNRWKLVREVHEERNFFVKNATTVTEKLKVRIKRFYDEQYNLRRADKVVLLTSVELNTVWLGRRNFTVIPNPVSFKCEMPSKLVEKRVISAGRLDNMKNFRALINSFKAVCERYPDWRLDIFGDGPEMSSLRRQIEQEGLENWVFLRGFTNEIQNEFRTSSIFALTSLSEGFGMVLIEAMECGLPVVAYDCPTGPSDIIADGKNGFLVPLNDEKMMTERLCTLIENQELRERMGHCAREMAGNYQIEPIINRWMQLFNEL